MKLDLFAETLFIVDITLFVIFCFLFVTIITLIVKHKLNLK